MFEEDVRALLRADPGLAPLVGEAIGDRVGWALRPQAGELPALGLTLVTGGHDEDLDGPTVRQPLVQIDCWAADYPAAKRLSRLVRAALLTAAFATAPFQGATLEDERDDDEPTDAPAAGTRAEIVFRTQLDVRVTYDETL